MLNKAMLQVAVKYLESGLSNCMAQFLDFGTKVRMLPRNLLFRKMVIGFLSLLSDWEMFVMYQASMWCRKHLKMTLMSTEESQEEEHSSLFFQVYNM